MTETETDQTIFIIEFVHCVQSKGLLTPRLKTFTVRFSQKKPYVSFGRSSTLFMLEVISKSVPWCHEKIQATQPRPPKKINTGFISSLRAISRQLKSPWTSVQTIQSHKWIRRDPSLVWKLHPNPKTGTGEGVGWIEYKSVYIFTIKSCYERIKSMTFGEIFCQMIQHSVCFATIIRAIYGGKTYVRILIRRTSSTLWRKGVEGSCCRRLFWEMDWCSSENRWNHEEGGTSRKASRHLLES